MFTVEGVLQAVTVEAEQLICIYAADGTHLCTATCGAMIGHEYRSRLVDSVTHSNGDVIIKLAC